MDRICFIDDDRDFEIPLFERVFSNVYDVIAADSYLTARERMAARNDWIPDLFVLDLYFPSGTPDPAAIAALRRSAVAYHEDRGEIRAAYTNYLGARSRLQAVLDGWKQGPAGGLQIAQRVATDFPGVPIVFYSRKATFEDAMRCLATDGVWWLEKKPTGDNDEDTLRRTLAEKPRIVERFNAVIAGERRESTRAIKHSAAAVGEFVSTMLGENP